MLSDRTLRVTIQSSRDVLGVKHGGKNIPHLRLSLDIEDSCVFQQTDVKKGYGTQATWNETFQFSLNGQTNFFVEVMGAEKGVDKRIGFATIPLNQVPINHRFEFSNVNGEIVSALHFIIEERKSVKSPRYENDAVNLFLLILGGALVAGAGYLGIIDLDAVPQPKPSLSFI